jgi:hypothetical protein
VIEHVSGSVGCGSLSGTLTGLDVVSPLEEALPRWALRSTLTTLLHRISSAIAPARLHHQPTTAGKAKSGKKKKSKLTTTGKSSADEKSRKDEAAAVLASLQEVRDDSNEEDDSDSDAPAVCLLQLSPCHPSRHPHICACAFRNVVVVL